ncbi:molybdenum cofactor biosynthesis protein MoaE [Methanothermobacter sp. K4]|uniref:molybdenum cofactor biosynthesis protein MoaE n=1 Tax=Methanothermobacter sp. K4 TaxID=2913262 RepID=UPI001EDC2EE2|nr:molybdenum cofactor biosynthesis protein MoaE [Methanothermobacter sp. K4]MCG2829058.1 molybdenum cofactor biosynthesis protein MoaE [Methanothermobacter sp. K4]
MMVMVTDEKEAFRMDDLLEHVKKSPYLDECGAVFTFEGIVRGVDDERTEKLILTTPDIEKAQRELEGIVEDVMGKYPVRDVAVVHYVGEFYVSETLFMVAVAGPHRGETLEALKEIIERTKYEIDFKKEEYTSSGRNVIMSGG